MSPSEQSPLLNGDGRRRPSPSFYEKLLALLKAEGEPSWLDSFKWFVFGSWANFLLLLVPVAAASHFLDWDAPLRFGFCFIAIVPLAKVRTHSEPLTRGLVIRNRLFAILTDLSSAARRCHRTDVAVPWTNSCWLIECHFWQRG
jgi:hypothetical protein